MGQGSQGLTWVGMASLAPCSSTIRPNSKSSLCLKLPNSRETVAVVCNCKVHGEWEWNFGLMYLHQSQEFDSYFPMSI